MALTGPFGDICKPVAGNDKNLCSVKRKLAGDWEPNAALDHSKIPKLDDVEYSSNTQELSRKFNALIWPDVDKTRISQQSKPDPQFHHDRKTGVSNKAMEVFAIPELMEMILMEVPPKSLIVATRVSKAFIDTVKGSRKLMTRLGFEPAKLTKKQEEFGPTYNEALFEDTDLLQQRLVIGGWSVILHLAERVVLDPDTGDVLQPWTMMVHAAPVCTRLYTYDKTDEFVMAHVDWEKRASMSCMQMLLLNKPVDTVFYLSVPHLPKKTITIGSGSALHTYGQLFNYLQLISRQLATPFFLQWFNHWERLEAETAASLHAIRDDERWHPLPNYRIFPLPKSRLLSVNNCFKQYKADYIARKGGAPAMGNAP
ncbi:hypothetical protein AMS68_005185 [Peltaster fructicola]|uniref:F-box domain-containing protein n=1 Tax=Peltaster fructicola TaxID=286661 RepID=A0A6H0XYJ5_9PEZI|nr:hypothetical protein AMS68_005185 [Peltaster fructicola]